MSVEGCHKKCPRCKTYRLPDSFLNPNMRVLKCCAICRCREKVARDRDRCEHGKQPHQCKDCGGASICEHGVFKIACKNCDDSGICRHGRREYTCIDCRGKGVCCHNKVRYRCKECYSPVDVAIRGWIRSSRQTDKKKNRFNEQDFIDKTFLQLLVEQHPNCYWSCCNQPLQYLENRHDLATIERLDNSVGHVKKNCVIACLRCNCMRKSNHPIRLELE